ncbi:MAG: hypothetical protein HY682_02450 [Chloroflexi bacterium]|nr:hypothetical protein [Chloroflexota bacterium]
MPQKQKTFTFHWGSGRITEEAQVEGRHHQPTLQLLEYTDGEAKGHVSIRFCTYSLNGRFSRSPLMASTEDIEKLREALKSTPRLRALLKRLVS